jgi:hypothetical protein
MNDLNNISVVFDCVSVSLLLLYVITLLKEPIRI